MKKRSHWMIIAIAAGLGLLLVGCSRIQAAASGAANNTRDNTGKQNSMPLPMQLALDTLSLEETDKVVTPEQAAELLPLWKAAKSLSNADNVAPQELEGLYKQIQRTMTSEQVKAIQSIDLTGPNMAALSEKYEIMLPRNGFGNTTQGPQPTAQAGQQGGGAPPADFGGGPPMMGGGPPGAGGPMGGGASSSSRSSNRSSSQKAQGGFETILYQAVIDLLEKKIH